MVLPAEVQAALVTAAVSIPSVLGATWLGGWMARRQARDVAREAARLEGERFTRERLWDARREVYTKLISLLGEFRDKAKIVYNRMHDPSGDSAEEYYASNDYSDRALQRGLAYASVVKFFRENRLIVSDGVAARLERMVRECTDPARENEIPPEYASSSFVIARDTHDDVLAIALNELVPDR